MSEAAALLAHGRAVDGPPPYTVFDRVHLRAVDFFRRRASVARPVEGVAQDQVLTRELLEEAERADGVH